MTRKPVLINLVGPTASGKTKVALELALALGTEIISADSRQIYKEMRIGTAVPSEEELQAVKHHFIRSVSIQEPYSASQFEKDALEKIKTLSEKYPKILMTGGTGLYFHAVNYGLDDIPEVPLEIRLELNRLFETQGIEILQKELLEKDPAYYRLADIQNPRRLIRALEVIRHTGKPFSDFRRAKPKQRPFESIWFGLYWPREILYERINKRTEMMIQNGLLAEAEQLYPFRHLNALQTVGYRELFEYLDGKISFDQAVNEIKKNTRRYAKRQMTWFNKNPVIKWIDMTRENPIQVIMEQIEKL